MRTLTGCAVAVALLTGCTGAAPLGSAGTGPDAAVPGTVAAVAAPEAGTCRALPAAAVERPDDSSPAVPCRDPHTAETFAVGEFGDRLATAGIDDARLSERVLDVCGRRFRRTVGADESLALRTVLTWAWFRPSPEAWEAGARWYRCDLLAQDPEGLRELQGSAQGVLLGRPEDRWLLCASGEQLAEAPRVACDRPHDWRAVTTVVLGGPGEVYPGDRVVEVRTRDFCSDSVRGWLGYPVAFDYGYTWLGSAEWQAGERRSTCWARTGR